MNRFAARLTPAERARLSRLTVGPMSKRRRRYDIVNAPPKPVELKGVPMTEGLDPRDLVKERFGDPASEAHAASRQRAARFGAPQGAEAVRCRACGIPVTKTDDGYKHIGPTSCTRVVLDGESSA